MNEKMMNIKKIALEELKDLNKEADVLNCKAKYLGKKSELNELLSSLKDLSVEEKKVMGPLLNQTKRELEEAFSKKIEEINNHIDYDFDETLPVYAKTGSLHPVTLVIKDMTDILKRMGFTVVSGPEMEKEYYNFEALNIPKDHPARDMQDTYYLSNGDLLRTHTSPNQVRAMQKYGAPLKVCAPGRVFRNEDMDANHETTFFQLEGMVIDKGVSISNLIYVMRSLLSETFKKDVRVRLRPGFFPFTEPSFELDCSCLMCDGKGCPTCKGAGWIEFCGCGMIHPNVLRESGIDPEEYTGFAFGFGVTRLAMMKYKIGDIRVLNSGDVRALNEFEVE
ncbi:TPA: phenylalanine--tRNA ligase subunit alpha [Candidatus Ventrenecus stercoripullorum]|nr:phenylalanine--tRNA ligase subunit alpha [Candidatus Ventrenecus stercoripullorum]